MKKNIIIHILLFFIFFVVGFTSTNIINNFTGKYECKFETEEKIEIEDLITLDKLNIVINSSSKYSSLDSNTLLDDYEIINDNNIYTIKCSKKYYQDSFSKTNKKMISSSKKFIQTLLEQSISQDKINYLYDSIIIETNTFNPYLGGSIVLIILSIITIVIEVITRKKIVLNDQNTISIFQTNYWKEAKEFVSNPKKIATLAMLFSLLLISKMIKIPSGFSTLGLGFGFIFFSIIGHLFGPIAGLIIGFFSDILGFFLFDTSGYGFFFGYVLQAMISGFLHGLILYKKNPSFFRLFILRLLISLICNIIIGSICQGIVANYTFDQTITYMLIAVIPKNIIYLIPQTIVLYFLFKALNPILQKYTKNK